jgi:hypothetical protein
MQHVKNPFALLVKGGAGDETAKRLQAVEPTGSAEG